MRWLANRPSEVDGTVAGVKYAESIDQPMGEPMTETELAAAAERLMEVLLDASINKHTDPDLIFLDIASWARVLDIMLPQLEAHRAAARERL